MGIRIQAWFLSLVLSGIGLCQAAAQIDPTLFGDHLGPAISELPDTGEDWLAVEEESPAAEKAIPAPETGAEFPGASDDPADAPKSTESQAAREKPEQRKSSWFRLPWSNKSREREERLAEERAASGFKLGEFRKGQVQDQGYVDSGISPSELRRWKRDPRKAMIQAREERKLLLLWMTDSFLTNCKTQAIEVFRHTQFLRMARDYMVLTKIDFAEADIASHPYTRELKDKLNVLGSPVLILFSPDSKEVWRYTGYRSGRHPEIIGALRFQIKSHALKERHRHETLVESGFRDWVNDRDESVFAKAIDVSLEDRTVLFVDDLGEHYRYPVVKLSEEDRAWLAERFLR